MTVRLWGLLALGLLGFLPANAAVARTPDQLNFGQSDLAGFVTGANGPEAGIWVIAEMIDLPIKFAKIVVTDDLGRYLIRDLSSANYEVWTRGCGLIDSIKVNSRPGRNLDIKSFAAPTPGDAT